MKPIRINENEKKEILGLHGSKIITEEATGGKTIADLQKLLGVKADGYLGPQTLAAIKSKLGQPVVTQPQTTQPQTTAQPEQKTPEAAPIASLKATGISSSGVSTQSVGGTTTTTQKVTIPSSDSRDF